MDKKLLIVLTMILFVATFCFSTGEQEAGDTGPVKLVVFKGGSGDMPSPEDDLFRKELLERLNILVEMNAIASGDYQQQLNIRIAGGNSPDLFELGSKQQLQNVVKQGAALPLDEYIPKMPRIAEAFSDDLLSKGDIDGTLYAIPRRPYARYNSFWVRQDWLDNLGLEKPTTLEEFTAVAKAFTYDDPDGNGKDDTYALSGIPNNILFSALFGAFGTVPTVTQGQWMIQDNEPLYSVTDPKLKDAVAYIKSLIDAGVVDPELVANTNNTLWDKVYGGQVGMLYFGMWRLIKLNFVEIYKSVNPDAEWAQMYPPAGPDGTVYDGAWDDSNISALWAWRDTLPDDPKKLDAAITLFDYVTSGEGQELVLFGLEGVHFNMVEDTMTPTDKMAELNYAWNYQLTGRDEMWYLKMKFPFSTPYLKFVADLPYIPVYNSQVTVPAGMDATDRYRYEEEQIIGFMYGNRPLDEWDDFVQSLYKNYDLEKFEAQAEKDLKSAGYIQ